MKFNVPKDESTKSWFKRLPLATYIFLFLLTLPFSVDAGLTAGFILTDWLIKLLEFCSEGLGRLGDVLSIIGIFASILGVFIIEAAGWTFYVLSFFCEGLAYLVEFTSPIWVMFFGIVILMILSALILFILKPILSITEWANGGFMPFLAWGSMTVFFLTVLIFPEELNDKQSLIVGGSLVLSLFFFMYTLKWRWPTYAFSAVFLLGFIVFPWNNQMGFIAWNSSENLISPYEQTQHTPQYVHSYSSDGGLIYHVAYDERGLKAVNSALGVLLRLNPNLLEPQARSGMKLPGKGSIKEARVGRTRFGHSKPLKITLMARGLSHGKLSKSSANLIKGKAIQFGLFTSRSFAKVADKTTRPIRYVMSKNRQKVQNAVPWFKPKPAAKPIVYTGKVDRSGGTSSKVSSITPRDRTALGLTAQTTGKGAKVKANGEFTTSRSAERRTSELSKQSHFEKHGGEFKGADGKPKYKNAEEYAKGARDFLNNPPKGTLTRESPNGDIKRFNETTGEFAAMAKDGKVKTYFKPEPKSLENPEGFRADRFGNAKEYFYGE